LVSATRSTNDDGYAGTVTASSCGPQPREARCAPMAEAPNRTSTDDQAHDCPNIGADLTADTTSCPVADMKDAR
jgi:hypothetical protein